MAVSKTAIKSGANDSKCCFRTVSGINLSKKESFENLLKLPKWFGERGWGWGGHLHELNTGTIEGDKILYFIFIFYLKAIK